MDQDPMCKCGAIRSAHDEYRPKQWGYCPDTWCLRYEPAGGNNEMGKKG